MSDSNLPKEWHETCPTGDLWINHPGKCACYAIEEVHAMPPNPKPNFPVKGSINGPVECNCYHCAGKPDDEKGMEPCEYYDHHCENCHERELCTTKECNP